MTFYLRLLLLFLVLSANAASHAQNRQHTWVFRQLSPPANSNANVEQIYVDVHGDVYLGASCIGNVDADPGPGDSIVVSTSSNNSMVTKLSASGQFKWSRYIGGPGFNGKIGGVAADAQGNTVIGGYISDSMDLDPGAPLLVRDAGQNVDAFLISLDTVGNFQWGHMIGGNGWSQILATTMDSLGNSYVVGRFTDTIDVNPGGMPVRLICPPGLQGAGFVAEYDPAGMLVWAHPFVATQLAIAKAIALDPAGNVVFTGLFDGVCDFNPDSQDTLILTAGGNGQNGDAFVCKLTSQGDFIWARSIGGPDNAYYDTATELCIGPDGTLYVGGHFDGTLDCDPSPTGVYNISANNSLNFNSYVVKLDSGGHFLAAFPLLGSSRALVQALAVTGSGQLAVGGYFEGNIDLDPGPNTYLQNLSGSVNSFILTIDTSGNFVAGYTMGGYINRVYAMATNASGDLLAGGGFVTSMRLDPLNPLDTLQGQSGAGIGFVLSGLGITVSVSPSIPSAPLTLSPNPASTRLSIGLPSLLHNEVCHIEVLNTLGQVLWTTRCLGTANLEVEVADLPAGRYYVRVASPQHTGQGAFVKY